jgi:hypothetical protein
MQGEAERALRCRPPSLPNRAHFDADSIDSAIPRPLTERPYSSVLLSRIPRPADLASTERTFFDLLERPVSQRLIADLFARGLQNRDDLELNMGERLGPQPDGSAAGGRLSGAS